MEEHFSKTNASLEFVKKNKMFTVLIIITSLLMVGTLAFLVVELSDSPISDRYKNINMEKQYEIKQRMG